MRSVQCEQRQLRRQVRTLPFPCRLFDKGIVQQAPDVVLILRNTLPARELSRKFQISYREPDANLLARWFKDVRPSQFARMVQLFIEKVRFDLL